MNVKLLASTLLLAAPLAGPLAAPFFGPLAERSHPAPSADAARARADFERLKSLAGQWVQVDENGVAATESNWSFRVTAGGSAVLETLFEGSEQEMVTLYFLEDDELALTHYCVVGNQPHMHAVPAEEGTLSFECSSDAGLEPGEAHMHRGTMHLLGPDEIATDWRMFSGEAVVHTAAFRLRRLRDPAR